jgi:hypothetical protein
LKWVVLDAEVVVVFPDRYGYREYDPPAFGLPMLDPYFVWPSYNCRKDPTPGKSVRRPQMSRDIVHTPCWLTNKISDLIDKRSYLSPGKNKTDNDLSIFPPPP